MASQKPDEKRSQLQDLHDPLLHQAKVRLLVKRDDLIHPEISGNKWRKLKYNLEDARNQGHSTLLSFGGAFSNHIAALAAAGRGFGFKTIGVIRGEAPSATNPTLKMASKNGMTLKFVTRSTYKQKDSLDFLELLRKEYGSFYLLPEGGTNGAALKGCREMVTDIEMDYDFFCCSVGTGGTFCGTLDALKPGQRALGISALKGDFMEAEVRQLLDQHHVQPVASWDINTSYHFGGYARFDETLIAFINRFRTEHGIQLDPIYTGKLFFAVLYLVNSGYFPEGSTLLVLHSGGLQGIAGFNQQNGNLITV